MLTRFWSASKRWQGGLSSDPDLKHVRTTLRVGSRPEARRDDDWVGVPLFCPTDNLLVGI